MRNKIKIITDNGCDLPVEWLEKNNIHLIRFGLNIDGVEYVVHTYEDIKCNEKIGLSVDAYEICLMKVDGSCKKIIK